MPKMKIDPMAGIKVVRCKGCKKKFVSYGTMICPTCATPKFGGE